MNGVKNNQAKLPVLVLIQKKLQVQLCKIKPHSGNRQIRKMKSEVAVAQLTGVLGVTGMMKLYWQVARKQITNLKSSHLKMTISMKDNKTIRVSESEVNHQHRLLAARQVPEVQMTQVTF